MNIRELHIFRHLAQSLHFGKTSRTCNITPSALTRMIQRMETEVGTPLFIRDSRSVALTSAGKAFLHYARDVSQRWIDFQNEISTARHLVGSLSIYGSVTAVYSILSSLLSRFRDSHPSVQIRLETGDAARALTLLLNGEVDVSIAALPEKIPGNLAVMEITQTPLVFIGPASMPEIVVYHNGIINWEQTPLIIADQGLSRERLDRWLLQEQISANIHAQVAGNEAIIAMVSLGCGVGVIPLLVLEKSPLRHEIKILEDCPPLLPFSIGLCTLKKQRHAPKIAALWDMAAAISSLPDPAPPETGS